MMTLDMPNHKEIMKEGKVRVSKRLKIDIKNFFQEIMVKVKGRIRDRK